MTSFQPHLANRTWRRVAVAVLLAGALSACGQVDTGAGQAAQVGDQQLKVQTVLDQSSEIEAIATAGGGEAPNATDVNRAQVSAWVEQQITAATADALNVTVTDGDVDRFLDQVAQQNNVTREQFEKQFAIQAGSWVAPSTLDEFTRTYLQQQAIAAELVPDGSSEERSAALNTELAKSSAKLDVSVSPRYGSWDPVNARVSDPVNDLSSPGRLPEPDLTAEPTQPSQG